MCELLVARRLTRRVVLTRLLVGHTHEDIDAIFALIWECMKNKKVLTPQLYASLVAMTCKTKAPIVTLKNLWAVPDYTSYVEDFINPNLGRYAKSKFLLYASSYYIKMLLIQCTLSQVDGRSYKLYLKLWTPVAPRIERNIRTESKCPTEPTREIMSSFCASK